MVGGCRGINNAEEPAAVLIFGASGKEPKDGEESAAYTPLFQPFGTQCELRIWDEPCFDDLPNGLRSADLRFGGNHV